MVGGLTGFSFWGQLISLLFMTLIVLGFAWLLITLIRKAARTSTGMNLAAGETSPPAREILRQRYARGEISREEDQQMIADLQE